MKVYLNYERLTEVTENTLGKDGPWSGNREEESTYRDIFLSGEKTEVNYDTLEMEDLPEGTPFWGIYAIYSTGDSFSSHHSGCIELCFVSKDHDEIQHVYSILGDSRNSQYSLKVTYGDKTYTLYRPWMGYFERLVSLNIIEGVV